MEQWEETQEYKHAFAKWQKRTDGSSPTREFRLSDEYRNARLMYRRRVNKSTWAETT